MQLHSRTGVGVTFIELEGNLDSRSAAEFENSLRPFLGVSEPRLLLDFSRVDYISSAGIRVLLTALKTAKAKHGEIRCVGVGRSIKEIFDIVGLSQHLGIFPRRASALASFGLDVTQRSERGMEIFRLEGNLENVAGGFLRKWLDSLRTKPGAVVLIDLGAVNYAAIECLRILQEASAQFAAGGGALVLLAAQETVCEAMEVSGLAREMRLAKTVDEALALLPKTPARSREGNSARIDEKAP